MEQYIQKDALVAEIKKRLRELEAIKTQREWTTAELGDIACCKQLSAFINTLEVKEVDSMQEDPKDKFKVGDDITVNGKEPVSKDLDKEMDDFFIKMQVQEHENIFEDTFKKIARHFANWQKKQDQKSMEIMNEVYFKSCDKIRRQMIDKACKYLQEHREEVETEDNGIAGWISDEFIIDFRTAIEKLIKALQEEPVSEDLDEAARKDAKIERSDDSEVGYDLNRYGGFIAGAKWKKEHLWKPADGDDLPEYDREVIAILDYDFGHCGVVYAHRPNPNGWNGTNIDTGEKEHFEPEIYDKGGWNQPHVLYWLDTKLPYEENKIIK